MINAGIIGLGRWGQNLVNSIQGKSDKIRVVAGATRTRAQEAVDYAAKQGFPLVDSVAALLADPKIDAVILATPHTQRVELITAAAKAGKHVFTEKPLTLTSAEAAPCLKVCTDHKVTLAVGYNWRFQPALQEMKRMLEDGRLGVIQHIEGNFCGPSVYRFGKEHWRLRPEEGPAGGMTGSRRWAASARSRLASPFPGSIAGPVSPPARISARVSRTRSPCRCERL